MPRAAVKRLLKAAMRRSVGPQDVLKANQAGKATKATAFKPKEAITNGLEASVYAYRCATIIGLGVGSVPLEVRRRVSGRGGEQWEPVPEHPLQKLLEQPNERDGWSDFALRTTYLLMFGGDAYWSKLRSNLSGLSNADPTITMGVPSELWPWGPDKWSPIRGGKDEDFVTGYLSEVDKSTVPAHDIVHLMRPSIADDYHGFPEYRVAKRDIDTDLKAGVHQEASLDNQGVPSGMLKYKEAEGLEDEEWDALIEHFMEEYFGAKNARRPMALGNEVEWIQMAMTMLELDYVNSRKLTREAICIAMGVSPIVAGILDRSTYSNYDQAIEATWDLATIPLLLKMVRAINTGVAAEFGDDIKVFPVTRHVDALFGKHERRMKLAQGLFKEGGIAWSVLNESYELGLFEWPGWDVAPTTWELATKLEARGVPWATLNKRFGLGLDPWPGWDISFRPANAMPIDTFLVDADGQL